MTSRVAGQRDPIVLHADTAADGDGEVLQLSPNGPNIFVVTYEPGVGFNGSLNYKASLDGTTYFTVAGAKHTDHTLSTADTGATAIARQFDLTGWLYFKASISGRSAGACSSKAWFSK